MQPLFGQTRTKVTPRHALITPDGHVPSQFPHWLGSTAIVIISPAMGANLSQLLITFDTPNGIACFPADQHEHVFYIESGSATTTYSDQTQLLHQGDFLFLPPHTEFNISANPGTRITLFRKIYQPLPNITAPPVTYGSAKDIPAEPFLGLQNARLQILLPIAPAFDLAMNIFTYDPGATLPFVETHIMEHGLLMLAGQGVYRLEDAYYPVQAGDAIWMAPYCPQWFVAMGDTPASYLYYKDIQRLP